MDWQGLLTEFRGSFMPHEQQTRAGIDWSYYVGGEGQRTLLVVHGGGGNAESLFAQLVGFGRHFRVIAPTVPRGLVAMEQVVDGLTAILDGQGVEQAAVYGPSFGGAVAQVFVRQATERIERLVLSHTGTPDADFIKEQEKMALRLQRFPGWLLMFSARRSFRRTLKDVDTGLNGAEIEFWVGYINKLYSGQFGKRDFIARATILGDFAANYTLSPRDLSDWTGQVMILESEHDRIFPPEDRAALRATYPGAHVHTFREGGHLNTLFKVDETVTRVTDFLS